VNTYVTTLVLDKVGRIVIPVQVRKEMNLVEGAAIRLSFDGEKITIEKGE
jgi:AbrB family looped-hinge helix DNA binding protein